MTHVDEYYVTYWGGEWSVAATYTLLIKVGKGGCYRSQTFQNIACPCPEPVDNENYRKLERMVRHLK